MRLFKLTQSIVFQEDSDAGLFKKDQEVTFSGSLRYYNEIVIGYLKQEPITCNSLVLYVKGHWAKNWETDNGELVLVETTKRADIIGFSPITICSYFPIFNGVADGYADQTIGIPSQEGQYFFIGGNYLAKTTIKMEELSVLTECYKINSEYARVEKKSNQMINRLYVAKNQSKLQFGDLFDCIQPHWGGAHWKLIDTYPNE